MGKGRGRSSSELEHLRGELRSLTSENRQLKRRVKELERKEHWFEQVATESPDAVQVHEDVDACKECGKGKLELLDLKHILIATCNHCKVKTRYKPNGSEIKTTQNSNSKTKRSK